SRMRTLRNAYPKSVAAEKSRRIVHALAALPLFTQARSVALFWPILEINEVDLRDLDAEARRAQRAVYYPLVERRQGSTKTGFARVDDPALLIRRGRVFAEPPPEAPRAERGDIELILVPALAVATNGYRLGQGSGFYDMTLPDFRPPARAIAVAFEFQLVSELPTSDRDVACDFVLTEARCIEVAGR
ncbi:MAG TPA: 5-formyltetrahydrofolate cyclo-ligase, partial [Polyangiaceae bacterium]